MSNWNFFRLRMNINGETPSPLITQWDLDDVTTGEEVNITAFITGSAATSNREPYVDPGGTRVYIPEQGENKIIQLSLSVANDLSSTITSVAKSPTLPSDYTYFQMSDDGSKAYGKTGNNVIQQFSLSTAFDISSMSTTSTVSVTPTMPPGDYWVNRCFHFNPDGTELYTISYSYSSTPFDLVAHKWELSTAFDLSTAGSETVTSIKTSWQTNNTFPTVGPNSINIIGDGNGNTYFILVSSAAAVAYKNTLSNAGVYDIKNSWAFGPADFQSTNDNDNIYYLNRSTGSPYVWTLGRYNTNIF